MKMFKRSLALMFAVLLCCITVFAVSANGEDNDVVDDWDGPVEEEGFAGDVNGDDAVNASDMLVVQKHIMGILTEAESQANDVMAADINGDDAVNASDMLIIQKYIMGILSADEITSNNLPTKA